MFYNANLGNRGTYYSHGAYTLAIKKKYGKAQGGEQALTPWKQKPLLLLDFCKREMSPSTGGNILINVLNNIKIYGITFVPPVLSM